MSSKRRSYPQRLRPRSRDERVILTVRVTPEQKAFIARLGDGSLSIGFDRAVAAAVVEAR